MIGGLGVKRVPPVLQSVPFSQIQIHTEIEGWLPSRQFAEIRVGVMLRVKVRVALTLRVRVMLRFRVGKFIYTQITLVRSLIPQLVQLLFDWFSTVGLRWRGLTCSTSAYIR